MKEPGRTESVVANQPGWLVGWSVGRSVGWLVGGMVGWLVGWLLGWLVRGIPACLLACVRPSFLGWPYRSKGYVVPCLSQLLDYCPGNAPNGSNFAPLLPGYPGIWFSVVLFVERLLTRRTPPCTEPMTCLSVLLRHEPTEAPRSLAPPPGTLQ